MKAIDNQGFLNLIQQGSEEVQFVLVHVAYIQVNFHVGAFYWARSLILTPYLGT